MGRPKKTEEGSEAILHKKFWIWDAIWEEPSQYWVGHSQADLPSHAAALPPPSVKKNKAENRTRQEATRAQLVRNIRERFDCDWMFAEQGSNLKRKIRNANGDWI